MIDKGELHKRQAADIEHLERQMSMTAEEQAIDMATRAGRARFVEEFDKLHPVAARNGDTLKDGEL